MVTEKETTRADSSSGKGSSALTALFASDVKVTFEDLPIFHDNPLTPNDVPHNQSHSYNYASNSFYQSYGESFSLPTMINNEPSHVESEDKTEYGSKCWVTVKELLSLIIEDSTKKQEESPRDSVDNYLILNGEIDILTKIESLSLFPAEEDGSLMDDLPPCTASSDIFNMGVRDFLIVEKNANRQLVHIRIDGNIADNEPYSGVLPTNQDIQVVSEDHPSFNRQASDQTENSGEDSYYTLEDLDLFNNPDTIQFFRTDTEEFRLQLLEQARTEQFSNNKLSPTKGNINRSSRHRSSSGNLLISYRTPESQRWQVAKKFAVLTEQSLKEHDLIESVPTSTAATMTRQQEIANQVRKQLQVDTKEIPIPDPRWFTIKEEEGENKNPSEERGVDRRPSERFYDDDRDGEIGSMKYTTTSSRKYSNVSSRSSSILELNPHTSTSLPAQYSPAGSVIGREDSDDDQLGLIQIERTKPFFPSPSSPSYYSDRSYGRDDPIYSLSFHLESQLRNTNNNSPRHFKSSYDLSMDRSTFGIDEEEDSESEGDGSSSDEDERLPNHLNVNTEVVKLVPQTLKKHSTSSRFQAHYRHFPHQYKGSEKGGTETSSNHGSDKSSSRSSITSTKSAIARFFELFGGSSSSKKRHSFASESNDSIYSGGGTGTPKFRRSLVDSQQQLPPPQPQRNDNSERSSPSNRSTDHISLPIVQNLDTGDVFPVGALRYEAFKLPETVSPTVLFGNPSDKIHR